MFIGNTPAPMVLPIQTDRAGFDSSIFQFMKGISQRGLGSPLGESLYDFEMVNIDETLRSSVPGVLANDLLGSLNA